jgi:hypothetical protein
MIIQVAFEDDDRAVEAMSVGFPCRFREIRRLFPKKTPSCCRYWIENEQGLDYLRKASIPFKLEKEAVKNG